MRPGLAIATRVWPRMQAPEPDWEDHRRRGRQWSYLQWRLWASGPIEQDEIGRVTGITRQAVHDTLVRAYGHFEEADLKGGGLSEWIRSKEV